MLVGVPMVTYLQLFGALFIVAGLFVLGVARGGIHEVLSGVLIVGGSLMLGQAALIERMEKQLRAQEKLLDIWQEFEKSRKGGS